MPVKNLNPEVRLLLTLWGAEDGALKKGELTKRLVQKGQTSKTYQPVLDQLLNDGSIKLDKNQVSLTAQGIAALGRGLSNAEFEFAGNVGAKTVNALLKWIRQNNNAATVAPTNGKVTPIDSYDQFKQLTIEVYDRLNRDYNMGNLVPIYRIRREVGERVNRSQFDEWLLQMQSDETLQLIGGEMPEITPDKAADSVKTALGAVRYYAKIL